MAALEKRDGVYRIDFRFGGQRFRRSLNTDREKTALAVLARADDTLRRLELGQLTLPAGADITVFVLSDGRLDQRQKPPEFSTLVALLDEYLRTLTPGCLKATTEHSVNVHIRHFRRVFDENQALSSLDLQQYVDHRSKDKGLRGRTLSAITIKKELGTLGMVWSWATAKGYPGRTPRRDFRRPLQLAHRLQKNRRTTQRPI